MPYAAIWSGNWTKKTTRATSEKTKGVRVEGGGGGRGGRGVFGKLLL